MEYVGTAKAAEMLGLTRDYISKLCREGTFPGAVQDGKGCPWRIPVASIEAYSKRREKRMK